MPETPPGEHKDRSTAISTLMCTEELQGFLDACGKHSPHLTKAEAQAIDRQRQYLKRKPR